MKRLSRRYEPVDAEEWTLSAVRQRLQVVPRCPELVERAQCVHGTAGEQGTFRPNVVFLWPPRGVTCPVWLRW